MPIIARLSMTVLAVTTFILPLAEYAPAKSPDPAGGALEVVTLQLKWKHQFQFAGYYAALEKGFYRRAGLDVRIAEAVDGMDSTRAVIRGDAEFGIAMSDLIQLRALGHPIVALATIFQHSPLALVAPKRSGIENIHDLVGKKIALESHAEQLLAYFQAEGISARELIVYPHDYGISRLVSGELDAMSVYSTDEPFLLQKKGVDYSLFSPRAGGIDFYGDTLFTVESQVRDHPERVAAFLDASLEGWRYALDHTEETIDLILSKYSRRHSREHLRFEAERSKRLIMANVVELGYMNPGRWKHIAEAFKGLELIPENFSTKGFLYDRTPERDMRWIYLGLAVAVALAGVSFLITGRFYRLNRRLASEIEKHQGTIAALKEAQEQITTLKGILPICMHCKGIRDDSGYWNQIEHYISQHSDAQFSHGICDKCLKEHHPDLAGKKAGPDRGSRGDADNPGGPPEAGRKGGVKSPPTG